MSPFSFLTSLIVSLVPFFLGGDEAEIVFAGDAMQHDRQLEAAKRAGNGKEYDYSGCFSAIEPYISSADYAVVNLETSLGGAPYSGYPMFGSPDSYLDALAASGFDFFLSANNHTLDRRDRGLRRTIGEFEKRGLPWTGIWRSEAHRDSINPRIVSVKGFSVAILNYTYGTNGIAVQGDVVVDYIDRERIRRDVELARMKGAEIVAVCIHWGDEYHLLPDKTQQKLADYLVSLGVDLVIGGHPHVIQPMEMRTGPDGRRHLVVYSLGNFISAMRTADTRGGALVRVRLARDPMGQAIVKEASYRLVFTMVPTDSTPNYHLVPAEMPVRSDYEPKRLEFERNAERIFIRHNVDVARDTLPVERYQRRTPRLLPLLK